MYEYVPLPNTWAKRSYDNTPHHLIELSQYSDEYIDIQDHFDGYQILSIQRVQNRYQYGRYLIFKMQKNSPAEWIYFMPLRHGAELTMALRYNCDYRRLGYTRDMFFPTVSAATPFCDNFNKLVVVQGLNGFTNHDSGRYAKYVVTYQRDD